MEGFVFEGAHNRKRKSARKQEQTIAVLIKIRFAFTGFYFRGTQRQFSENICS